MAELPEVKSEPPPPPSALGEVIVKVVFEATVMTWLILSSNKAEDKV